MPIFNYKGNPFSGALNKAGGSIRVGSDDFECPSKAGREGLFFHVDLVTIGPTVSHRTTKIGKIIHLTGAYYGFSHFPIVRGRGRGAPNFEVFLPLLRAL